MRRAATALAALPLVLAGCTGGDKTPEPLPPIATDDCPAPDELLSPAQASLVNGRRRLPDLTLSCLGSARTVSLRALGGDRPVVLNLWASWCQPCRQEMPAFEKVHQALGGKVLFLGVDTRDVERPARQTIQATGISYASVVDKDERLRKELDAVGLPDTVLVDVRGEITWLNVGELTEQELRDAIKTHLGVA